MGEEKRLSLFKESEKKKLLKEKDIKKMKSLILIGGALARYEEFVIERDPIENVLSQCHLYSNPNRCTWDQPICGQDAFNSPFTFKNPCLLLFEYCTGNRTLKFLNFGRRMQHDFVENSDSDVEEAEEIEPECPMCLSRIYNPVCLRSGVEVDRCEFDRGLCTGRFESESEIAHEGNCDKKCPRFCNRMRIETCGSDGVIYSNPCMLKDANCRSADKYILLRMILNLVAPKHVHEFANRSVAITEKHIITDVMFESQMRKNVLATVPAQ